MAARPARSGSGRRERRADLRGPVRWPLHRPGRRDAGGDHRIDGLLRTAAGRGQRRPARLGTAAPPAVARHPARRARCGDHARRPARPPTQHHRAAVGSARPRRAGERIAAAGPAGRFRRSGGVGVDAGRGRRRGAGGLGAAGRLPRHARDGEGRVGVPVAGDRDGRGRAAAADRTHHAAWPDPGHQPAVRRPGGDRPGQLADPGQAGRPDGGRWPCDRRGRAVAGAPLSRWAAPGAGSRRSASRPRRRQRRGGTSGWGCRRRGSPRRGSRTGHPGARPRRGSAPRHPG